ncbi:hypothetical protein T05_4248 [Trichinella murrelli]|uniref:Uncharacterized protein n=1 Tax=Trichinella murrelli TaxID=144512 RepID=A0A0V0TU76_9BILA|nr:hypothetical protein T05_4248 [Trichinella murrelli]
MKSQNHSHDCVHQSQSDWNGLPGKLNLYQKKPYKIVQILGLKTYQLRGNPGAQAPYTSGAF